MAAPPALRLREIVHAGRRISFDLGPQVLRFELREDVRYVWGDGSPAADAGDRVEEPPLEPLLPRGTARGFVSAAMLALKAKQFDDGLYAAVEVALQEAGPTGVRRAFLGWLRRRLAETGASGRGAAVLVAAADLGGVAGPTPSLLAPVVRSETERFLAEELRSKPLGFYTWSEDLARVFRQDRMLQSVLSPPDALELLDALRATPAALDAYQRVLDLQARLTNPPSGEALRALLDPAPGRPPPSGVSILPPSRAHETDLVKRHWGDRPVPEGASALDLLVGEVKAGRHSLAPTPMSGWYDHQTFALEPLIRPEVAVEAPKVRLGPLYLAYLEELFRGLLALTRETHVKQLEITPTAAAPDRDPPLTLRPALLVEPLATHYLRRAEAYAFVRQVLEAEFGARGLASLRRLTADGPVKTDLATELALMETLFRGAGETALAELGAAAASPSGRAAQDRAALRAWAEGLGEDPDLARDARMMVPVFFDVARGAVKAWVFLGWTTQTMDVEFVTPPVLVGASGAGGPPRVEHAGASYLLASPVVAETYVTRLLDRAEFRAHCDRYCTRSEILRHLR